MIPRKLNNSKETPAFSRAFAHPVRQKYLHVQADPEMSDTRIGKSLMLLCFCFCFFFPDLFPLYIFPTNLGIGSTSHLDRNVLHQRSMRSISFLFISLFFFVIFRFNDKVRHIKILTKDGCFYIAESRLFKTVLVRYFYTCCSEHLDVILYSNRTNACKCGNFGCTIFIGPSLFCFCDTLAHWISYLNAS